MNIKISKEENAFLMKHATMKCITIGSHLYGVNRPDSDQDYLLFYKTPDSWGLNSLPNIHQFQYTENNVDYIWTTEDQFWKNQRSGDSTINSDAIMFTDSLVSTKEDKLKYCRTYKVIKAYIGFAKRDIKYAREGEHKIKHAYRSLYCAQCLMENVIPELVFIKDIYKADYSSNIEVLKALETELRVKCNKMYENKELEMYYIPQVEDTLNQKLLDSNNTREFKYE